MLIILTLYVVLVWLLFWSSSSSNGDGAPARLRCWSPASSGSLCRSWCGSARTRPIC